MLVGYQQLNFSTERGANKMTTLLTGLLIGIAFGYILQRAGATKSEHILDTLLLKDLGILKMMLTAISIGVVGFYALSQFGLGNFDIKTTYVGGVIIGGLIFGVGFAVAGYCPGTMLAATGAGKKDAMVAGAGGLVGALTLAVTYPWLKPYLIDPLNFGKITLADLFSASSILVALTFAGLLAVILFIIIRKDIKEQSTTISEKSSSAGS